MLNTSDQLSQVDTERVPPPGYFYEVQAYTSHRDIDVFNWHTILSGVDLAHAMNCAENLRKIMYSDDICLSKRSAYDGVRSHHWTSDELDEFLVKENGWDPIEGLGN